MTSPMPADPVHLLSGLALALSFLLLFQQRPRAMVRAYAAQALAAALVLAWHGWYGPSVSAGLGGAVLAGGVAVMPAILRRRAEGRQGSDVVGRAVPAEQGSVLTLVLGIAVVGVSVAAVQGTPLPPAGTATPTREDLAFALAIALLGLLTAASRPTRLGQAIGLLSMWNGLVIAAAGGNTLALLAAGSAGLLAPAAALLTGSDEASAGPSGHAAGRTPASP